MILRVRRIFFEITTFPTVASEPAFMRRCYMHEQNTSELWVIQVILLTSMSYFDSAVLLDEAAQTDITRTLTRDWFFRRALHRGGWRVSVSPTLVEPSVAMPGPCEG